MRKVLVSLLLVSFCGNATAQSQKPVQQPTPDLRLTIQDAEQLAIKNNPSLSASRLRTLAQGQVTREVRSALLPQATVNLTAVEPKEASRITAGGLNNPILYERAAAGVSVQQLLTDFGRTRNLVASARFRQDAQRSTDLATQAEIVFAVDQAFYRALQSVALLHVAESTVQARQDVADQIGALTKAKLKSDLDLSFANVNLAQAQLLLLDASNAKDEAFANLNALLGFENQQTYTLVDETAQPPGPPQDAAALVKLAFQSRPDLSAVEEEWQAAERFRRAEHDLQRPTLSTMAVVGDTPIRADQLSPWYGAVGVNLSIPIFNGFQFSARAREADYRADAQRKMIQDLRNRISRDVQVSYLAAQSSYSRIAVTQQLLAQANMALDLAQTRYKLGLGSIVEVSQAQLQQTEAAIGNTNARYGYEAALSSLRFQTGR